MTTSQPSKQCECGCGAPVVRRFKPGHDAKLKSRLVQDARSNQWWIRDFAVAELVERDWAHFADAESLAVANWHKRDRSGRWTKSLHVQQVEAWVVDAKGTGHAHAGCGDVEGGLVEGDAVWTCGTCSHSQDLSEVVWSSRKRQWLVA